ncbi:right-handed parallel beta-helix repeat-containing protein [Halococcus sp. IIIV-5B]|uniref:right-handed parallel beta-helix repeat-containing protein n=1 Tax=Halococcus sp. IIIV-5B TaxID=2321230 RepID=UPI000E7508CB|nr:right-handed parallel beta-helix repeat-containing protein [Halococcus sp. IIIV-5B]RJT04143.1 right-handed parallel beta-helix repeat-containing protein [Halococcus sp. IIIV-5B]
MPRNGARDDSDSTDSGFKPSRRSYLKAAGAAAVSVPLLAGEGAAATERHGISFDNVVDMGGTGDASSAIESAAADNTLLKFPSGTYDLTGRTNVSGKSNFGIVGEGDVTFTVPDGFEDKILNINGGSGVLVENITIDQSNAAPCVQVAPDDDLQVHGLEMPATGGYDRSDGSAANAFNPMVRSSGGSGTVTNLLLHNAGEMGAYSRVGVWIGEENKGTITLRDCNVEGFSNNGVYASRTPGEVHVEGGVYKNNDLSQVRIGSSGSYIDGVSIEVDTDESRSDNPGEMNNGSGIRLEKGSGAVVRNCDISIGSDANSNGGITVFDTNGAFTIENTRIEFNADGYGIRGTAPSGVSGDVAATLKNVSVTGGSSSKASILIEERDGTTIEDCCVQTGSGRKGVYLRNCGDSTISNTTIDAGGKPLQLSGSNVTESGISYGGSCPAPSLSSSSYEGSSVSSVEDDSSSDDSDEESSDDSDDSDSSEDSEDSSSDESSSDSEEESSDESDSDDSDESDSSEDSEDSSSDDSDSEDDSDEGDSDSDDSSGNDDGSGSDNELSGDIDESDMPEPEDSANLVITDTSTEGGRIPYEFTTSGDLEKSQTGGATQDDNDDISGNTATGGVQSYRDAYEYEGELVALEVEDYATIKLDDDAGTITVMGEDESGTEYSLEVTGTLEHIDDSTDPISDDGSSVSGGVGTFRDEYSYTGKLVQASIEDSASITTDPETLDE